MTTSKLREKIEKELNQPKYNLSTHQVYQIRDMVLSVFLRTMKGILPGKKMSEEDEKIFKKYGVDEIDINIGFNSCLDEIQKKIHELEGGGEV